jgi:hypothetical protein
MPLSPVSFAPLQGDRMRLAKRRQAMQQMSPEQLQLGTDTKQANLDMIRAQLNAANQKAQQQKMINDALKSYFGGGVEDGGGQQQGQPGQMQPGHPIQGQSSQKDQLIKAILHKQYGMPLESPEDKGQRELKQKVSLEEQKVQAKERGAWHKERPDLVQRIQDINEMEKLASKHIGKAKEDGMSWYGPGNMMLEKFNLSGPEFRKRSINHPDYGRLETLQSGLVAPMSKELSSRGLVSSIEFAKNMKPGFSDNPNVALGKMRQIKKKYLDTLARYDKLHGTGGRSKVEDQFKQVIKDKVTPKGTTQTVTDEETVIMISPQGKRVPVPKSMAQQALKKGGRYA